MLLNITQKLCRKCGETKPLDEFHKTNQIKSGYGTWCEVCYKKYHANYYHKNEEVVKDRAKRHHVENKDKHILQMKQWVIQNRAKSREIKKAWKKKNPEKVQEHHRKRRTQIKESGDSITFREWSDLKKFYNYTCLCCRRTEPEIKLELDHVLPIALGGRHVIENAQPLCRSCNAAKYTKHIDYRPAFMKRNGCEQVF